MTGPPPRRLLREWRQPWPARVTRWTAVEAARHDYNAAVEDELSEGWRPLEEWSDKWSPELHYERRRDALLDPSAGVAYDRTGALIEHVAGFSLQRDPALPRHALAPRDAPRLRGAHLMAFNGVEFNVGHFLMDVAVSVLPLLDEIRSGRLRLATTPLSDWRRDALGAIGVDVGAVTELTGPVVAEHLVVPSALDRSNIWAPRIELVGELYRRLAASVPDGPPGPALVYAGRLGMAPPSRQAIGEAELAAALGELGFVTVEGSELSIAEKVRCFRSARVVVGPYGANLAAVGVCRPGARVVVCNPSRMVEPWLPGVALAMGLRLGFVMCPEVDEAAQGQSDYRLDIPAIVERARRAVAWEG